MHGIHAAKAEVWECILVSLVLFDEIGMPVEFNFATQIECKAPDLCRPFLETKIAWN